MKVEAHPGPSAPSAWRRAVSQLQQQNVKKRTGRPSALDNRPEGSSKNGPSGSRTSVSNGVAYEKLPVVGSELGCKVGCCNIVCLLVVSAFSYDPAPAARRLALSALAGVIRSGRSGGAAR